jgi:hypothetical protein
MLGTSGELDLSCHGTPDATPKRDTSTPMSLSEGSEVITITTDHGVPRLPPTKKRKRHIAIDVETERGKQTGQGLAGLKKGKQAFCLLTSMPLFPHCFLKARKEQHCSFHIREMNC